MCTCTLFVPRRTKETKCKTCGHRQVSHSGDSVPSRNVEPLENPKVSENKYVDRLLKSLKATEVHESARKEMVGGFRPPISTGNVRCVYASIIMLLTLSVIPAHLEEDEG